MKLIQSLLSDALQEYQSQLEVCRLHRSSINDAGIRQDIIQFVIDYIVELDGPKVWTLMTQKLHNNYRKNN